MVYVDLSGGNSGKIYPMASYYAVLDLNLSSGQIKKIENLPNSLRCLWLNNNKITKIENLSGSIENLLLRNNRITKIENLPDSLTDLCLTCNQITKIENLPSSLQELKLFNNQITKIENLHCSLKVLDLRYNKITKIKNLPDSLRELDLSFNQITKIENIPSSLRKLNLSSNQITEIANLPSSLWKLNLSFNQITKIENLPSSLHVLRIYMNKIKELPISLLELIHIYDFHYYNNPDENMRHDDNPIEYIHPLVVRWLERLEDEETRYKVYSDGQNIHDSSIQKSFRNSLGNLLKDRNTLSLEECKKHVLECNGLEEQVKRELLNYCDDDTEHSVYLVKFDEVFQYVISRIVGHPESIEMFKILNEEIKDTICKCFTGRMTRLVNVLNGFYDDITIHIGSNEQISNIIIMLKEKYEGDELVKQVRLEMEEREYDNETIEEWLGFL